MNSEIITWKIENNYKIIKIDFKITRIDFKKIRKIFIPMTKTDERKIKLYEQSFITVKEVYNI